MPETVKWPPPSISLEGDLLVMAEDWARAAGSTLAFRPKLMPTMFAVRAQPHGTLLAAAVELFDRVCLSAEGRQVARDFGFQPLQKDGEGE